MVRERAHEEITAAADDESASRLDEGLAPLSYSYRHGNGLAEILAADLRDAGGLAIELFETGEPLTMRVLARIKQDLDDVVIGFLISNRHGISAYGTNTKEQQIEFGAARRGDLLEVTFSFACWLGVDNYSVSCAVHSRDGEAYDWVDGVRFFRVTCGVKTEGVANLNARASVRHLKATPAAESEGHLAEALSA